MLKVLDRNLKLLFRTLFISIFLIFIVGGCAPKKFEVFHPPVIELPTPEKYDVEEDISKIPKPDKIKRMYGKFGEGGALTIVTDPEQADVFILLPKEYAKINMLKELAITYKHIIIKQMDLINLKNESINELQRLLILTERERDIALSAWENSENAYRQEKYEHEWNNRINKTAMYIITIGSIILLAVGI